jgi:hypothetical protein
LKRFYCKEAPARHNATATEIFCCGPVVSCDRKGMNSAPGNLCCSAA